MANRIMDEFCGSKFWDWNLTWFTNDIPEFTPCFEETILIWAPCSVLFLLFAYDFRRSYSNEFRNIPWGWLNISKVVGVTGLLTLTFLDLTYAYLWHPVGLIMHNVDYSSALIKHIAFFLVGILVIVHRKNGVRTSATLFFFWLLFVFCSFPHYITIIRKTIPGSSDIQEKFYPFVSNMIYFPLIVSMLILELFVDSTPLYSEFRPKKNLPPCTDTSFIGATLSLWFDSYALKFYRTSLHAKDLWNLKYQQTTDYLVPLFYKYWNAAVSADRKKSNASLRRKYGYKFDPISEYGSNGTPTLFDQYRNQSKQFHYEKLTRRRRTGLKYISIVPILWKEFKSEYISATCIKVLFDSSMFLSPLILSLLINYEENDEPTWRGYLYTILLILLTGVQAMLINTYVYEMLSSGLAIRSTLMSVIYRKVLKVSNNAKKQFSSGDISNLMSVDAQRFYDSNLYMNSGIGAPMIISLALFFLWRLIGYSAFAGVAVLLITIPINTIAATKIKELQTKQMKFKDERIKITSEVLSGIKTLKMYAWEDSFEKKILSIRNDEIRMLRYIGYLSTIISVFLTNIPYLVSLATFAVYTLADEKNILTTDVAFVSLAVINLMKQPISILPRTIVNLVQTWVATKRINKFLNIEELDPFDVTHNKMERYPLVIENGKFTWNGEDNHDEKITCTLWDINLRVQVGSLVAIVGTVGCGKSSLLSALLGEMKRVGGRVNTKGSIAYVPQQAWLQNATIKDNILFTSTYNAEIYNKVVESCALTPDFQVLLTGDQTEIGEKGINLSGGQKQRISLARSVYNNADIYLLDDPLSAVDAHVGRHIFEHVIGPKGLLRNKTRVLVTHSINFLPETDLIVVMKNGTIAECDSYDRLMSKEDGEFGNFIKNFSRNTNESDTVVSDVHVDHAWKSKQGIRNDQQPYLRSLSEEFPPLLNEETIVMERITAEDSSLDNEQFRPKFSSKETVQEGNIKLAVYLYYMQSGGTALWIACALCNIIYQAFVTGGNMWLSTWSTASNREIERERFDYRDDSRIFYLEVYALYGIGQVIGVILLTLTMYLATANASARMHQLMLHKVLRWPSSLFDVTPIGNVINRISFDLDVLDNLFPVTLRQLFILGGTVITTLYVISYSNAWFILFIVPLVLVYVFLQQLYVSTQRQLKRLEAVSRAPVYSLFNEAISGSSVIRAYGMQTHFILELDRRIYENQMRTYPSIEAQKWIGLRLDLLGNVILLLTSLLAVLGRHVVDSGMVSLAIMYSMQIMGSLNWTIRTWSDIETNIVSVERIKDIEKTPQEKSTVFHSTSLTSETWPTKGEIIFENYEMRYRDGLDLVLRGLNIKINSGEKIGIVGRTGSGKSSLTLSLFRIVEAASGRILVDGIDISTVDLNKLRSKITIIPQDPVLFSGTVRLNLDPFFEYCDHELWHALEIAYLKNHIQSLAGGLEHVVSESGDNFSIGQRQLICLARALLRKTKILIMDEATAAIDLETDQLIQTTIKREFKSCTVLTIAHKLNTIMDSDRIIVLENGRVKEFDSPDALLTLQPRTSFYQMAKEANLVS